MYRTPDRIIPATSVMEGEGVTVRRSFPTHKLEDFDPFLLLDHLGPTSLAPNEAKGFPDHPHRGFETVTYVLDGQFAHRDSHGNQGLLGPGDIQWMTAGSGLVHSEMPGPDLVRNGGRLHGFQLWINLPKRDKMSAPKYQELTGNQIPVIHDGGVTIRLIAGEAKGQRGLIETRIPITYLHITLDPGAEYTQTIPAAQNAFAYVIDGEASFGGGTPPAAEGNIVLFKNDAAQIRIAAAKRTNLLLIAGEPIHEPVARYGPFVMNTREELVQAYEDYQAGKMGRL